MGTAHQDVIDTPPLLQSFITIITAIDPDHQEDIVLLVLEIHFTSVTEIKWLRRDIMGQRQWLNKPHLESLNHLLLT